MSALTRIDVDTHPTLLLSAFVARWPARLGDLPAPEWLRGLLAGGEPDAGDEAPGAADDALRGLIRDLLRFGGFKPTGRSKPSSEYLLRAVSEGALGSINAAVDIGNAVSLRSGLPISVVDVDRLVGGARLGLAAAGARYVFNATGQEIDVGGLLCLHDEEGPCANPVKDAQRTKTTPETRTTLTLIYGHRGAAPRVERTGRWCRALTARLGAEVCEIGELALRVG